MALAQLASEPYGTKLEAVARKGKRAGRLRSVLSIISSGICGMSSFMPLFAAEADEVILSAFLNMFQNLTQLLAEEAGYDCREALHSLPSRWAFVALEMLAFSNPLCL